MTYKSVIDRIFDACNRHYMIADWGYGQLSDIKVLDEGGNANADYPYAFLNPAGVTRNEQAITYNFNLIVMEMAITPQSIVRIQSDAMQYIEDLISDLRFDAKFSGDVSLQQSITPFRERFQDEVAGATANFNITVAQPIDNCTAPFSKWIVEYGFPDNYVREPDPVGIVINTTEPTWDSQSLWFSSAALDRKYTGVYLKESDKEYQIVIEGTARALESKPIPLTPRLSGTITTIEVPPVVIGGAVTATIVSSTWPEGQVDIGDFSWTATYNYTSRTLTGTEQEALTWALRGDAVPADESQMEFITTSIKIAEA